MRVQRHDNSGYVMWLSANDTYNWAHRASNSWPGSTLSNRRMVVVVDSNGVCDLMVNGRSDMDVDPTELAACVGDHLPRDLQHLWPEWAV